MKKAVIIIIGVMLVFGCSKDNSTEPNNNSSYYPKTIYERSLDDPATDLYLSEEFVYNSNMQLIRINEYSLDGSLSQHHEFQYNSNNFVSRIDEYSYDSNRFTQRDVTHKFKLFIYVSNKLVQRDNYSFEGEDEILESYQTYEYEEDKCTKTYFFGSNNEDDYHAYAIFAYDDIGNVVHYAYISDEETNERFYEYDNNFNWLSNVTPTFIWKFPFYIPVNNVSNEYNDYSEFNSTFEYNEDNYPTKITIQRYWGGNYDPSESSEIHIEYEMN